MARSPRQGGDVGIEQLVAALASIDVDAERSGPTELMLDVDGRRSGPWKVTSLAAITPTQAATLVADLTSLQIVVSGRSHRAAVEHLRVSGVGYYGLDNGRLAIRADGVRIDTVVAPIRPIGGDQTRTPALTPRSQAGLIVAYELLDHHDRSLSPRRDADRLGVSSSSISLVLRSLGERGLIEKDGLAITPELFTALADAWRPDRAWLASAPREARATVCGPPGASAWGAPIITTADALDLYVTDEAERLLLIRQCGAAPAGSTPWSVAVGPVPQACEPATDAPLVHGMPAAPIVAVALDLAIDPARGAEALDAWNPDPEVHARVW